MAASHKLTDLVQANSANSSTLLYIVNDPSGTPTSNSISVKGLFESNVSANVAIGGHAVITGKAIANAIQVNYTSTPANSIDVPVGFANNTIWSDGNYLYVVSGTGALKRVAVSSW